MKSAFVSILLGVLALLPCAAKEQPCSFRVHTEANTNGGTAFSNAVPAQFVGRNVAIEETPSISERNVVAVYPYLAPDGSYGVLVQLDDHAKLALDAAGAEGRGSFLYVFVNGRPIGELRVDRQISHGQICLASGLTAADIVSMRKTWCLIGQHRK